MRNFHISEFDSPDEKGSGKHMKKLTLSMIDLARDIAKVKFVISSGYRTTTHNKKVGGVKGSAHTRGYAFDIKCTTSKNRLKIVSALLDAGFTRIGVSKSFIHADNDTSKPKDVMWTY